jgi:hypothetical protein
LTTTATFLGTFTLAYPQYLDAGPGLTGTTLVAEPLTTYQIALADAWQLGIPPGDDLWETPVPLLGAGFNAIPGQAVAGQSSPGYSGAGGGPEDDFAVLDASFGGALTVPAPVSAMFFGTSPRMYTQYLDVDAAAAGTALVAEPFNTYQIAIADAWDISGIPGDGLWGAAPYGFIGFTSTPGFAIIGGLCPGFPGFSQADDAVEDVFEPFAVAVTHVPAMRVVRGRARKLRPAPARRRRKTTVGARP